MEKIQEGNYLGVKEMEDEKLAELKMVYDELWSDARTMISAR
jgi:hypothetical protein